MTLDKALEVLNANRHRGSDQWHIVKGLRKVYVRPDPATPVWACLSEFEVVAIAEKYEREGADVCTEVKP